MKQWRVVLLADDTRLTPWGAVLLCVPGAVLMAVVMVFSAFEWYRVCLRADPSVIADYHFGSESMVGEGGDHYRSAETYCRSTLLSTLGCMPFLAAFLAAMYRRSLRLTVVSYVAVGLVVLLGNLV